MPPNAIAATAAIPTALPALGPFADRFLLEERIGTGGFGTVYRALDRARKRRVALKVPHGSEVRTLRATKEEFRVLADVSHPNLVAFHELFVGPEQWFFTMELVRGVDCVRWCERVGPSGILPVVRGLAAGLEALHARGIVHRDLKPSNAWVDARGTPVLLDFGLARDADGAGRGERLAGTPAYLAPEVIAGEAPTPAADLYALGVVVHQLLTGRLPEPRGASEATVGLVPSPGAPRALVSIVERLLDPDPRGRPSAREVLAAVDPSWSGDEARAHLPFVGRSPELEALDARLARARAGHVQLVFVEGPAGIGKTALVDAWLGRALRAEDRALRARCSEHEAVPFKALDGAMDALVARLRAEPGWAERAGREEDLRALEEVFPVLAELADEPSQGRRPSSSSPQERRRRAGQALARVLGALAVERTVVVVIDDAHWADEDGARLLEETLSSLAGCAVVVVVVHRSQAECAALQILGRLGRDAGLRRRATLEVHRLVVGPLGPSDASAMLGAPAEAVLAISQGSPFLIETLAATGAALEGCDAETAVRRVIEAQLERLPAAQRAVLETVCVAGHAVPHDVLADALGAEADVATLRALVSARLVRTRPWPLRSEHAIEAYHDRLREIVVELVGPTRRPRVHAALAAAFSARADEEPMWTCLHLEGSGQLARAARYAEEGARRAAVALAFARAAALFRFAVEHGAYDEPARRTLEVELADALANAGRGHEAAQALLAAAGRTRDAAEGHVLRRRAAEQYLRAGYFRDGASHLDAVLDEAGVRVRRGPLASIASLLANRRWLARHGLEAADRVASPEDVRRIEALWSGAIGLSVVDSIRSADLMSEAVRLCLERGDRAPRDAAALVGGVRGERGGARRAADASDPRGGRARGRARRDPLRARAARLRVRPHRVPPRPLRRGARTLRVGARDLRRRDAGQDQGGLHPAHLPQRDARHRRQARRARHADRGARADRRSARRALRARQPAAGPDDPPVAGRGSSRARTRGERARWRASRWTASSSSTGSTSGVVS